MTIVVEMLFLKDRGKGLVVYTLSIMFGVVVGPNFTGFIVEEAPWSVQF